MLGYVLEGGIRPNQQSLYHILTKERNPDILFFRIFTRQEVPMASPIFDYNNSFWQWLSRLTDLFGLSLCWLMCSLPLLTVGAATTTVAVWNLNVAVTAAATERIFLFVCLNIWLR